MHACAFFTFVCSLMQFVRAGVCVSKCARVSMPVRVVCARVCMKCMHASTHSCVR